ncbi:MAG: hypothetical protein RLZZ04_695 [Cyanobacteriota bacterium]|jgi:hypothetical protein
MNKLNISNTITLEDKVIAHHTSDGSELIPAEVRAGTKEEINQRQHKPLKAGYTIDDEGIMNNYAAEPATSLANYPSPEQQKRYLLMGVGATLLISSLLAIAFTVS